LVQQSLSPPGQVSPSFVHPPELELAAVVALLDVVVVELALLDVVVVELVDDEVPPPVLAVLVAALLDACVPAPPLPPLSWKPIFGKQAVAVTMPAAAGPVSARRT
jgi:hypothetical protein